MPTRARWRPSSVLVGRLLAAVSVVATALAIVVPAAGSFERPFGHYVIVVATLYPVVGAVIVSRHPANLVGWLLLAVGLLEVATALAAVWAILALDVAPRALPAGTVAAWLSDGLWIPAHGVVVTFLLLLFPDGRLPSRRWWPVAAFSAGAISLQFAAPMSLLPQIPLRTSYDQFYPDERLAELLGGLGYGAVLIAAILCVTSLLWRLARMRAEQRGPYVWFAGGAVLTVMLLLPISLVTDPFALELLRLTAVIALPVGAAVAIVRHQAYGIDVVVNRTLLYVTLSAVLVGIYLAVASVVQFLTDGPGAFATVSGAAATATVLAPARNRLQRLVNRLMYGQRDDAQDVVAVIGGRLEAVVGTGDRLADVTAEIARALRLPYVAIEAAEQEPTITLAATGTSTANAERLPLHVDGELVGRLAVSPRRGQAQLTTRDRIALAEIGRIVATAVKHEQLTAELQRSRERLAGDLEEERRRIRRDLHDGLGPTLATIVMGLDETRAVHRADPQRADVLLQELKDQTRQAIEDIRALVYGLRPPALDDLGLLGAVRHALALTTTRSEISVGLDTPTQLPPLPAAVEVAAYRIVHEALTNVVRHSGASSITVSLSCLGEDLRVTVSDDGCGLASDHVPGVGMSSIQERVQDVGGSVSIRSGNGTTVDARLPMGRR